MDAVLLEALAIYTIIGGAVLIPVFGLTARFALRPIVEAIIRLRETSPRAVESVRVAELASEVERMAEELSRLKEIVHFERSLTLSDGDPRVMVAPTDVDGSEASADAGGQWFPR